HSAYQAHVVIERKPTEDDGAFGLVESFLNQPLVMQEVPVRHHDASRGARRTGSILEERQRIAVDSRLSPAVAVRQVNIVCRHPLQRFEFWRTLPQGLDL